MLGQKEFVGYAQKKGQKQMAGKRKREECMREARRWVSLAMRLDRENKLLREAGYFDSNGNPRKDAEGRRIRDSLQPQLSALPPITDAEIDAELLRIAEQLHSEKPA
jgi:hypothetical protein